MSDMFEQQSDPTPESSAPAPVSENTGSPAPEPEYDVPGVGRVPVQELTRGYLRQADYTRKRQEAALREREVSGWQNERQQYEQALGSLREFLQDRARLAAYLQTLPGGQPETDPNEILTAARAQELLQAREQATQKMIEERIEAMRQEMIGTTLHTQFSEQVNSKLRELGQRYPDLRSIPGMEGLLREAVKAQNPQSIQEAYSLFDQAAAYYMKTIDGLARARAAKVQASPVRNGIEPPGGAAPAPRGESQDFSGVKDPRLRDAVMRDITRILSQGGV